MADSRQDAALGAIWRTLSPDRLDGGYGGGGVPREEILARYLWNVALCEALYPSLQMLEVALRNTVFDAGCAVYPAGVPAPPGRVPCWLDTPGLLHAQEASKVNAARTALRNAGKPLEPGRLVAELTFGFWTALFDVRYENNRFLWPRLFSQKIFGAAPRDRRSRKALSPLLNRVRYLRNRAFHHEPIWHWRDLREQHALTPALIGWMSPPLLRTVRMMDRFEAAHSGGLQTVCLAVTNLGADLTGSEILSFQQQSPAAPPS